MKIGINDFAPHKIAIFVTAMIISFTLIPVNLYEETIKEKNYMFLDIASYIYILISLLLFFVGCLVAYSFFSGKTEKYTEAFRFKRKALVFANVSASLSSIVFIFVIGKSYNIFFLLSNNVSSKAPSLRLAVNSVVRNGNIAFVTPLALSAIVYLAYVKSATRYQRSNKSLKTFFNLWYYTNITLYILTCLLLFNKSPIITLFLSLFIVNILTRVRSKKINAAKTTISVLAVVLFTLMIFIYFQSVRYSGSFSALASLIGYFPASMNRFSALINGHLAYPISGTGIYSFEGIFFFPFLSGFFHFPYLLSLVGVNLPNDGFENWQQSFIYIKQSGLNESFNWLSIYGYTFQDFGWLGVLWFAIYGFFAGYFWKLFKIGNVLGIIIYPFVIFSFQWWSTPVIFNRDSMFIYIFAFILYYFSRAKIRSSEKSKNRLFRIKRRSNA